MTRRTRFGLLAFAAVLSSACGDRLDPAPATPWSAAPNLQSARLDQTATLLADGRVLVTGGLVNVPFGQPGPVATTELFDPAKDVWTAAPPMSLSRDGHAAALLADGRVLVTGGRTDAQDANGRRGAPTAEAEIFDPRTASWTRSAPSIVARYSHTLTSLLDGRVLLTGGVRIDEAHSGFPASESELYDPVIDRWSAAPPWAEPRVCEAVVALRDGRVLVAGGAVPSDSGTPDLEPLYYLSGQSKRALASVEIFDPRLGRWSPASPMAEGRICPSAVLLGDGRVLVAGGRKPYSAVDPQAVPGDPSYGRTRIERLASAEVFDPAADRWSATGPMSLARVGHTLTALEDGAVLAAGTTFGYSRENPRPSAVAELYDPQRGSWSPSGSIGQARYQHTATKLRDGRVLVVGGWTEDIGLDSFIRQTATALLWGSVRK